MRVARAWPCPRARPRSRGRASRRRARRAARPRSRAGPGSGGAAHFSAFGRLTHSCTPWKSPPLSTRCSGGFSMWRIPAPAVIHWVSPFVITPPPPFESWCSKIAVEHVGDGLEPAVRVPGRALRLAGRVLDLAHLVHVDERVEVGAGRRRRTRGGPGTPHPRTPTGRRSRSERPGGAPRARQSGMRRERGQIVDGDGRHGGFPLRWARDAVLRAIPASPGLPYVASGAGHVRLE